MGSHDKEGRVITRFVLTKCVDDWYVLDPWIIGQPEGTKAEWKEVIDSLRKNRICKFKRVQMEPLPNGNVRWSSPRNSNGSAVEMPKGQVEEFIRQALSTLIRG